MQQAQTFYDKWPRKAIFLTAFLMAGTYTMAQSRVIGVVKDQAGEPLTGVNVAEKGSGKRTVTDINGRFTIDTQKGQILVFSYIGFQTKETKVNSDFINVAMADNVRELNEVVVVGYGSMTRKDITSSITTLKAEDLNVGVYTSPAQMMQGKVPGLTVVQSSDPSAGTVSITLRGASSLREGAAMEPYYVIDGIPGMSLDLVAPEDIESIDVLRDATATAIYGSKAANGVIIVTTKKGNRNGKANVSYSGYIAVDKIMKNLNMMTADELRDYARQHEVTLSNDEGADTDWQKEVQRIALSHNHNFSVSGGNERTRYNASFNYIDRQGIIQGTDMDRLTGRAFVEAKALNDRLTISLNLNGSVTNNHTVPTNIQGGSVYDAMNYYSPLVPVYNNDGGWFEVYGSTQNYNPLSMIYEDTQNSENKLIQGVGKASLEIIDGLKWNLDLSYQNEQDIWNYYNSTKSQVVKKNGQAHRLAVENKKRLLETYLNYDRIFGNNHKLGLMAGYSWEQSDDNDGFGLTVYNFYDDYLSYYNLGMGNKMDISGIDNSSLLSTLRMISFYGRINYSFIEKYLFQATVRRDGSSAFGANNRWGTFPSVSAAWRLSEENFIRDLNIFDDLKIRAGYGISGNSLGFDVYTARQTYTSEGWFSYTDANGITSDYRLLAAAKNANPDLKWEKTGMLNIGLDFAVLKGRLSGTVEYYDKQTSDLIYYYPVSTNRYPCSTMTANVGDISNRGVEITINAVPVKNHSFSWETSLNLSHNKNEVKRLSNETYSVDYIDPDGSDPNIGGFSGVKVQRIMEGQPIGTFYMYEWAGYNENGISQFYVHDPETGERTGETTISPQETDRTIVGCAQPKLTMGWNNTFIWKKWSLTAFFQGVFGNKIFNGTRAQYSNMTNLTTSKNLLAEVVTEQNFSDINAQAPSDRYLENGSYLRLSVLTLGYDFGKLGNWINGLRIYATCNNVFTFTGYKGIDPEINLGGLTPGIDSRETYYPRTRSFLLGFNVNF